MCGCILFSMQCMGVYTCMQVHAMHAWMYTVHPHVHGRAWMCTVPHACVLIWPWKVGMQPHCPVPAVLPLLHSLPLSFISDSGTRQQDLSLLNKTLPHGMWSDAVSEGLVTLQSCLHQSHGPLVPHTRSKLCRDELSWALQGTDRTPFLRVPIRDKRPKPIKTG